MRKEAISVAWSRRKKCNVGGGSDGGMVHGESGENREMMGWKAVKQRDRPSDQSEEVITRSRCGFCRG